MSHSYRHYRQVKVINNGRQFSPIIDSFEEIVFDEKRQVYYWNKLADIPKWNDSDFLISSFIDSDSNRVDADEFSPRVRYLNPHEVIMRDLTYPQTKRTQQNLKLSQLKTSIQKTVTHLKKVAQRLPLAFKAAWRELISDY
ncbi:hypothetical protein [Crocosphaera chwakensis]|uniref:Uncharacterized protein n=1 Tax=Crocosphaera chwakensis CCY0110 TaxID=391612 RepID=A3IZC3_9CHRO|nr:hypothetical protein [Crocosphaera chwakensis]EAZ88180.1 hypothetical protein CY0110_28639 [Crocosphaera chwakensis CCY0110]